MKENTNNEIPESIKSYKIGKEAYKLSNMILYTATNMDINEKVLIHIFPKAKIKITANDVTLMNNQAYLMKLLNHKNILQLYEIIETKTHAFMIYEYIEGMKLSDFISKNKKLNEEESMSIFKEVLSALVYIHEMNLCDLNLSSNNIIIDHKKNIKICDFRYGHFYSTKQKYKASLIGDHAFACPELHSKKSYNPELADMWSCGILLFLLLTGNLPFKAKKDLDLIKSIIKGDLTIIPNYINANLKIIIKGLIEKSEEKRIKLKDLFNHKYFKDKKITKDSLAIGLNIITIKYPIDELVLNISKNYFQIDTSLIIKNLQNNKFTPITSLFKQIVNKLTSKGISTINDLVSDKFKSYVNNHNNDLKEEEQINNIQRYLQKEEDVKKNSQDIAAILLNNQNEISKGLEDLKKQFENLKKGIKTRRIRKSVDHGHSKRYQLESDKELMKKMNKIINNNQAIKLGNNNYSNKMKNINIKPLKRNTVLMADIKGFKILENKNLLQKGGVPNNNNNYNYGSKISNINRDKKNKKIENKPIEEIKEEKDKENELNKSSSEKSIKNSDNKNSPEIEDNKDEKKGEKKEEKKEEKEEKDLTSEKNSFKTQNIIPQKEEVISQIKMNISIKNNSKGDNKLFNPTLNKKPVKQNEQKPKKSILNNPQKDMNSINKKLENDKKVKLNLKKEEIDITKIKKGLKKGKNYNKSALDIGKNDNTNKNEPKVSGFKNIKEMIESNIKKQRVMSGKSIFTHKNKIKGNI